MKSSLKRYLTPLMIASLLWPFAASGAEETDPTAALLAELISVDTTNAPGNEGELAQLLAGKFTPLGFEIDIVPTPVAGKSHFFARLRGDGSLPPILLAAHADVVGVDREGWSVEPFEGVIRDGYVYGRGALDFKGGLAVFAEAVMRLAREDRALKRDVIFLAQADEETGLYGTQWLARHHWPLMAAEFALNEGGWIISDEAGEVRYVSVSTADKVYVTLRFTASGTTTHSSLPLADNAIFSLGRMLERLSRYHPPVQLQPITEQYFSTLARISDEPLRSHLQHLVSPPNPSALAAADAAISANTLWRSLSRNTVAPVIIRGGDRGNVIPPAASVDVNYRLLPGTDLDAFIAEMRTVVDDPAINIELVGAPGLSPEEALADRRRRLAIKPSTEDSVLFRALRATTREVYPRAEFTSYLFQAGTDAVAWRLRGVPVYGIYPYAINASEMARMHGNDERVSVEALARGTDYIHKTLLKVVQ